MRCASSVIEARAPQCSSVLLGLLLAISACYDGRDPLALRQASCAGCHGAGDQLAPPPGVWLEGSKTATSERGVGAHQAHLAEGELSLAVPCETCHVVPETIDAPGHLDDPLPAEVVFSGLAQARESTASWDGTSCTTYCHSSRLPGAEHPEPEWTRVDGSQSACDSCHGFPPGGSHPAGEQCYACHGAVVDESNTIIDKSKHINGVVEVVGGGGCAACHGGRQNDAPPRDTEGNVQISARGVGLHQIHVRSSDTHAAYDCSVCHQVPDAIDDPGHIDTPLPAEVTFGDIARGNARTTPLNIEATWDAAALTCTVYCHGLDGAGVPQPGWTARRPLVCGGCHGLPPAETLSGGSHPSSSLSRCALCHGSVVNSEGQIINPSLHANGRTDL
jgi:predicted CxxxxCH...CXXCH cytochrome family protein